MLKPKAKAYIDGANMFYTQKDVEFIIDWKKMKKYLSETWDIVELRYYTGVKTDDKKIRKYLQYLDYLGFAIISKPLKQIK